MGVIAAQTSEVVSLLSRRYLGGGILTRGERSRGHRAECPRDGSTRVTQLRNTCTMTGPTAACLELSGCLRVVTMVVVVPLGLPVSGLYRRTDLGFTWRVLAGLQIA